MRQVMVMRVSKAKEPTERVTINMFLGLCGYNTFIKFTLAVIITLNPFTNTLFFNSLIYVCVYIIFE